MSSQRGEYSEARTLMPDAERVKQDRRLIRAIKSGRSLAELMRAFDLGEARIVNLAKEHDLVIAKGKRGKRL